MVYVSQFFQASPITALSFLKVFMLSM